MDAIFEAILWFFELLSPDKNARYRRVQRIGCFLFGGIGILVAAFLIFDVFGGN